MRELTQAELKRLFHYDPETGYFTRRVKTCNRVKVGDIAGSPDTYGYVQISIYYKLYQAHQLAFLYMEGKFPEKGLQVDHVNHKKIDNRWLNLRIVTHQENLKNKSMRKDNTSGCLGVHRNKVREKWQSQISFNGKNKFLGYFDNIEDAIAARKAAEIKYGFHRNHGKFKEKV